MSLNAIPRLEEIAESPAAVSQLSSDVVEALLGKCSVAQGALVGRLLALRASGNGPREPERENLLTAEQAAPILGVTPRWLYRHSKKLPFARHLSRKVLRFSETGLRKWQATKRA